MIMLILTGLFYVILFALGAGVVISVVIFVPLAIYLIPYWLWLGNQFTIGRHQDRKNDRVFKSAKHATILYKSWILRKEPTF